MPHHWPFRRRLWRGARSVLPCLPVQRRGRAQHGRAQHANMELWRGVRVSEWHSREVRDGLRRASMWAKLRTLYWIRVRSAAEQQALRETVLALRDELFEMESEELDFFRHSRLSLSF